MCDVAFIDEIAMIFVFTLYPYMQESQNHQHKNSFDNNDPNVVPQYEGWLQHKNIDIYDTTQEQQDKYDVYNNVVKEIEGIQKQAHITESHKDQDILHKDIMHTKICNAFASVWLTTTDFEGIFDDMIDDIDELEKQIPWVVTIEALARVIKNNRLELQRKSQNADNQNNWDQKWLILWSIDQEINSAVLTIILWAMREDQISQWSKELSEQMSLLAYVLKNREKLDDKDKEKLRMWLEELLAIYLEGKIIEVYEIQIDDKGNIVIRWKDADWTSISLIISKDKVDELWIQIPPTLWDISQTMDIQSLWKDRIKKKLSIQDNSWHQWYNSSNAI